jgi:hypothetical protein
MRREANLKFMRFSHVHDEPAEIVILKRGISYHAIVAEPYRVKNVLTIQRPMPTVVAALEYLLDVTAEHLANLDQCSAGCVTPVGQFGETVENDLYLNRGSYYVPPVSPSATSGDARSDSEEDPESTVETSEPTSVDETPPPVYTIVQIAERLPTPFASSTGRGPQAPRRRRPASTMEDANEDDTMRGNTLRRSTRRRYDNQ